MKVELYPNQLFKIIDKTVTEKDEVFCNILLADGRKANVKIVEPIPIDKTRTKLDGATSKRVDDTIIDIIESKYRLKKITLSDEALDEIEEEVLTHKLSRKDKRKKQEELEKIAEDNIRKELMEKDIKTFFNSDIVYQTNGIFLDNKNFKSGLLQIPSDVRFKSRNIHLLKNDMAFLNISILDNQTKKIISYNQVKTLSNVDILINTDINFLTSKIGYDDIFQLNDYLLNKLSDIKNTTNKYDIHNILYLFVDKTEIESIFKKEDMEFIKEYQNLLYDTIIKPLRTLIKKYKSSGDIITKTDKREISNLFSKFNKTFIEYNDKTKLFKENKELLVKAKELFSNKLPSFVKITTSIFIPVNKRKEFVTYLLKDWTNSKESFFNIIKNKDKIDYFSKINDIPLEKIVGQFKFNKMYDDDNNLVLHKIFHYPAQESVETPTPRMMGYSFMEGVFIPNIMPPRTGKNSGFIPDFKLIEKMRISKK